MDRHGTELAQTVSLVAGGTGALGRAVSLALLAAGAVVSVVAGYEPWLIFVGLFLLGLGWNVGLIGGKELLTASVPATSRVEAQGTGDLTLSLCGAVAAFGSGFVKQGWGFHILADTATVVAGLMLVYAWYVQARFRRTGLIAAA